MASRRNFGARRKKEMAEQQKERRRAMQARHRATLAGLFDNLRNLVCPSEKAPAKWRILRQAKNLLLRQESYLEELLTMKEMFLPDEDGLCSLEEVREEYRRLHCQCRPPNTVTRCTRWTSKDLCSCARGETPCGGPGPGGIWDSDSSSSSSSSSEEELANVLDLSQSTSTSQSDIQEFEGYLRFYRQTVERLLGRGALRPEQTALAVVSDAILGLWHSLSPESRASFLPRSPEPSPLPWGSCSQEPPVPDPPAGSSQNSQGASGSSPSNFEEDLQDAYDVVQRDAHLSADKDSPARELQPREQRELYRHILSFMHTQPTQEVGVAADHDMGFLRCNETFDEDF